MNLLKYFSTVNEEFVRQHFKDAGEAEKLIAKHHKKAVVTLGVVVSFLVVFFVALGYAVIKINSTSAELSVVESTQAQLDQCMTNTLQQATDATAAQARAEEMNKVILVQLEDCSRKPNKK